MEFFPDTENFSPQGDFVLRYQQTKRWENKMFIDNDFPKLLGAELYRPHPAYIVEMAAEPVVVHDFTKQPK